MRGRGIYGLPGGTSRGAPLLVILGSDGDPRRNSDGGFRFQGNSDLFKLLPDDLPIEQVNLGRNFLRRNGRPDLARYDCVLNLITDPDQHPQALATAQKVLRGYSGRLINRPEAVLRTGRDQVARRLAGIAGLHVPKVVRLRNPKPGAASALAQRNGQAYPLIVRHAGAHGGRIVDLVLGPDALDAAAAGPGEFIITEFVDFRSSDGLYRKYRVFFIGKQRIFRHLIGADSWNIHGRERFAFMATRPGLIAEELKIIERPEGLFAEGVSDILDAVHELMGLEFFGMDFGIAADGRVVLFEANATMNYFPVVDEPPFSHINCVISPARDALLALVGLPATQSLPQLAAQPLMAAMK